LVTDARFLLPWTGPIFDHDDMEGLALPDPDDCQVLAAALAAKARTILTMNLRDFAREPQPKRAIVRGLPGRS
jgi:hypothetical protein